MKLFLHIGHFKTGTTAFQTLLAENRDALQRMGVAYPAGGERLAKQHGEMLARFAHLGQSDRLERTLEQHFEAPVVILSGETLSNVPDGAGRRICRWLARRCRVHALYTVREWESYLPSRYRQNVRMGDGQDFEAFVIASRREFAGNPDQNYRINVDEYASSDASLTVFEYDREICPRMLALIGIDSSRLRDPDRRDNVARSFLETETERMRNAAVNYALGRPQGRKFDTLVSRRLLSPPRALQELRSFVRQRIPQKMLVRLSETRRVDCVRPLEVAGERWGAFIDDLRSDSRLDFRPATGSASRPFSFSYSQGTPLDYPEFRAAFNDTVAAFVAERSPQGSGSGQGDAEQAHVVSALGRYLATLGAPAR